MAFDKCEAAGGSADDLIAVPIIAVKAGGGTALGCGYLGWGHEFDNVVAVFSAFWVPISSSQIPPQMRHHIILRHTFTDVVHDPKVELGFIISLRALPCATTSLLRDHPAAHLHRCGT